MGKIWWFCGRESKLCAMLRPAGSLLCGQSRLLLTADPTHQTRAAFFNQSQTDPRAEHMSVSMERTEGCLKAIIEVGV